MKIFHNTKDLESINKRSVVALGNFDGIHLGHQKVINTAMEISKNKGVHLNVFTFEPHPISVFDSSKKNFRLSPINIKTDLMKSIGVQTMFVQNFDINFSKITAHDFIVNYLINAFEVLDVVVGFDFVFGNRRLGNVDLLNSMADSLGFSLTVVEEYKTNKGYEISSTKIRNYLAAGDCENAALLLGRNWQIKSCVEKGDMRGRHLGFPTANLPLNEYVYPAKGVYAVKVQFDDGLGKHIFNGVANFGSRPTFNKNDVILEVHIFDFHGDIYGLEIKVEFIKFIRNEKKFSDLSLLKSQLNEDCKAAKNILSKI